LRKWAYQTRALRNVFILAGWHKNVLFSAWAGVQLQRADILIAMQVLRFLD